jgi:hypothetical protein
MATRFEKTSKYFILLQLSSMCLNAFENLSDGMNYFEIFSKYVGVHWASNRSSKSTIEMLWNWRVID